MALILSHKTACEYWLSSCTVSDYLLRSASKDSNGALQGAHPLHFLGHDGLSSCSDRPALLRRNASGIGVVPDAGTIEEFKLRYVDAIHSPLHLMVFNQTSRRTRPGCIFHVCDRHIPLDCFYELPAIAGHRVFVASPELCFLQLACSYPFLDLVKVGNALCSQYVVDKDLGLQYRVPVTDVAYLRKYCMQRKGHRGRSAALRALAYVADGAASPRETQVFLLLSMLRRQGGYGLPAPVLNRRVDIAGKGFYACDLLWPKERVAIEYDSDQWHSASAKLASDSRKRSALCASGYQVISVTNVQLMDTGDMDNVALALARALGKRLRGLDDITFRQKQRELRRELLAKPFEL